MKKLLLLLLLTGIIQSNLVAVTAINLTGKDYLISHSRDANLIRLRKQKWVHEEFKDPIGTAIKEFSIYNPETKGLLLKKETGFTGKETDSKFSLLILVNKSHNEKPDLDLIVIKDTNGEEQQKFTDAENKFYDSTLGAWINKNIEKVEKEIKE